MLRSAAQIDIIHVPYKGGAPAATDLMAGHLSMMFELGYAALPSIKAGSVKPIAVTSAKRLSALPDVPKAITEVASQAEGGTPEAFRKFIKSERTKWAAVINTANIAKE